MPLQWSHVLLVFLGGGLGSVLRYLVGIASLRLWGPDYPWSGTLTVNIVGSAVMGILAALLFSKYVPIEGRDTFRLFLMTGIVGGYTTFSAFSLDLYTLVERGDMVTALLYALGSVVLSLLALAAGLAAARALMA